MSRTKTSIAVALLGALAAGLIGCGGEQMAGSVEPNIDDIQQHILTPACATSGCHDSQDRAGDLDLSTAQVSYDSMVNVRSKIPVARAQGWVMVKPGDPDRSFLVRKLEGPGVGEGDPMPSSAQELHPYYVDVIRQWIEMGAPR